MALQDPQCIETGDSDTETLVLGESGTFVAREHSTIHAEMKKILMMDVAKVEKDNPSLLEEAGVESAWRDAMNIVDVLHDKTPEQNCRCVQPPERHAMNELLHDVMKRVSAGIGKTKWRLERRTNAMKKMHHNAQILVKKFYGASKNNGKKLGMANRR